MKTALIVIVTVIILIAAFSGAGYFGLPILIERETAGVKSEVNDLKQRLAKIEEILQRDEEARKAGQLSSGADVQKIINTVNDLFSKVTSLGETLKNQSETVDKTIKENLTRIQKIMFDAAMAGVRGHLLKVQIELKSKNIGNAKTELDLINGVFEKMKPSVPSEEKKFIEEFQSSLKKAKDEMDTNLAAAINRVDLLWHEMGKLVRKP